jgi:hypothetical protein
MIAMAGLSNFGRENTSMERASLASMELAERVNVFVQLGQLFQLFAETAPWPGHSCGLSEAEYAAFDRSITGAFTRNGWFTEDNVRHAIGGLAKMLNAQGLQQWLGNYAISADHRPKVIGLILAGNIPLVGFHDLLCTLIAGHMARVKCSSDDAGLTEAVVSLIGHLSPDLAARITVVKERLGEVDAVIATGSDNTARYFEHYFGHLPRIVRKSRTSVAVLDGTETPEELAALGDDLFRYFGLGCRNVTKLYVPRDFDLDRLFGVILPWGHIADHNKWANNYEYHKAIWMMDRVPLIENGFVLLKEDAGLHSPLGSIFYERYDDRAQVDALLNERASKVQCVVGHGHLPFGQAQCPGLGDYADGVDTMTFLLSL